MSKIFAVLSAVPGAASPEFSIVAADSPVDALGAAAQAHVAAGNENAEMIAVFTRSDLAQVDAMLAQAESQHPG